MSNANAIVVQNRGQQMLASLWSDDIVTILSSCPIAEAIKYKSTAERLETIGDKVIEVKDVVQHAVEMPDPDGVLIPTVRTIVVDAKGKAYAAISSGIVDSLTDFKALRGCKPPWDPPVKCKLQINRTNKGFHVYRLIPA